MRQQYSLHKLLSPDAGHSSSSLKTGEKCSKRLKKHWKL